MRVIPCLDVDAGRVVKGVNFTDLVDAGDPVEMARVYDAEGADELVFLDITASSGSRETTYDVVRRTAEQVFIPLTVGGGVRAVEDVDRLLRAGADKVGVNTAGIARPELLREIADLTSAGIGIEGVRRILQLDNQVTALRARNDELAAELAASLPAAPAGAVDADAEVVPAPRRRRRTGVVMVSSVAVISLVWSGTALVYVFAAIPAAAKRAWRKVKGSVWRPRGALKSLSFSISRLRRKTAHPPVSAVCLCVSLEPSLMPVFVTLGVRPS